MASGLLARDTTLLLRRKPLLPPVEPIQVLFDLGKWNSSRERECDCLHAFVEGTRLLQTVSRIRIHVTWNERRIDAVGKPPRVVHPKTAEPLLHFLLQPVHLRPHRAQRLPSGC